MAVPQDEDTQIQGDPIQQFFTMLDQLHRTMTHAQRAPDSRGWCDDCMNELTSGLNISLRCEWGPITEALIDTARVLHSYERAGKEALSLSFLKESHELLSLMGGDLIVDTVQIGAKQKWRQHYSKGVEELRTQGIPLIEDDEGGAGASEAPPLERGDQEVRAATQQDVPVSSPPAKTPEKEEDIPFDLPPLSESRDNEGLDPPDLPVMESDFPADFSVQDREPEANSPALFPPSPSDPALSEEPETQVEREEAPQESVDLESLAAPPEEPELLETPDPVETPPEEAPLESADAPAEMELPLQPSEAASGDACIHEALLCRAREAMTRGDIRNAKAVALELAVAMAQLEFEQANARLADSEHELLENARAIEEAHADIAAAEQELARAEEVFEARTGDCNACRDNVGRVDEELAGMSGALDDIEAQIAALEKQRTEQCARIAAKQDERASVIEEENRLQTELDGLVEETEAARNQRDEAHAKAQQRQDERRAVEAAIRLAREEAETHRISLDTIVKTLHPAGDAAEKAPLEEGSLL